MGFYRKYSRSELIKLLIELADKLGRIPTSRDMDMAEGFPHSSTYSAEYMSWNNALQEAGFKIHKQHEYTDEALIAKLQAYYNEFGRQPSEKGIKKNRSYLSTNTFRKHFGSWANALEKAGFKRRKNQYG